MGKITYDNKVFLTQNSEIADINKVTDNDLNEIKTVVNQNDDNVGDLGTLTTSNKSSIVGAINEVNSRLLSLYEYACSHTEDTLATDTWATLCSDATTDTLPAGTYMVIVNFSLTCTANTGSATLRPMIDGTEIMSVMRESVPTRAGKVTSGSLTAFITFDEASTHVINAQIYTGSTIKSSYDVKYHFIKLL